MDISYIEIAEYMFHNVVYSLVLASSMVVLVKLFKWIF